MYDVFNLFATDEKKEEEGVNIDLGGGASIIIARADNDNFLSKILSESELHSAEIKSLPEADAKALDRQILCEVIADTLLLGFKGMSYKGQAMKYSRANAVKLLGHKDFRKLVMQHANDINNFRVEEEDSSVKK